MQLLEQAVEVDGLVAALAHFVEFGRRMVRVIEDGEELAGEECDASLSGSSTGGSATHRQVQAGSGSGSGSGIHDSGSRALSRTIGTSHREPDEVPLRRGRGYVVGHNHSLLVSHDVFGYMWAAANGPVGLGADLSMALYREESNENVRQELLTIGLVLGANMLVLVLVYFMVLRGMIMRLVDESRLNHTFLDIIPLPMIRRSRQL